MMETLFVFPNPYVHVDHKGRLAGGCPEPEDRPATAMPARRLIGAKLEMVKGSLNKNESEGRGAMRLVGNDADYEFTFTATAPVKFQASHGQAHYLRRHDRTGDIFLCADATELPLQRLAEARIALIADQKARYGAAPDKAIWVRQFPLDEIIEPIAAAILEKQAVDAAEAAKKQPKKSDAADKPSGNDALEAAKQSAAKLIEALKTKPKSEPAQAGPAPAGTPEAAAAAAAKKEK